MVHLPVKRRNTRYTQTATVTPSTGGTTVSTAFTRQTSQTQRPDPPAEILNNGSTTTTQRKTAVT